jgi:hypothetical protein
VKARDEFGQESSEWSPPFTVYVEDAPPEAPRVTGPTSGDAGTPYTYEFTADDPNNDQVKFHIKWGDGSEEVSESYDTGETAQITHTWSTQGSYTIEVRAENTLEGPWSTLDVSMPKRMSRGIWALFEEFIEWVSTLMNRDIHPMTVRF